MAKLLGYIVQYYDDDSLVPYGPGKRLFTNYTDALDHAKEIRFKWLSENNPDIEKPVRMEDPTEEYVQIYHYGIVLESAAVNLWIETVYM
jgi:hypothetical protein